MPVVATPTREQYGRVQGCGTREADVPDAAAQFLYWLKPNEFGQSVQNQVKDQLGLFLG
jgi:hypothetical protein